MRYDFTHVYLISWWYDLPFLRIRVWQTKIGNYGSVFAILTPAPSLPHPAKNPKNPNFQKNNKLLEISFYRCVPKTTTIWGTVSEIEWDRQILSFWAIFCPFTPLPTQKIKILKKWKIHMKVPSLYICLPKITIIWCMLPEIWVQHTVFSHFGSFFSLLPHYWPQKWKIEKNKEIFAFTHVHNK